MNDPVHGSIHLSHLECDILSTKIFQRLHNVKQLGLGVAVYPGANYSRFSHSLGTCHLAGRMIDAIRRNSARKIHDREKQLYRLGGLLHDIGHYPFSHSFEHSLEDHYGGGGFIQGTSTAGLYYDHEDMGGVIINKSPEIAKTLKKHGFSKSAVSAIFLKETPGTLVAILSSDLDCDRLDYLMRTAHHAGLPYGRIDLNHLVNNTTLDDVGNVCLNRKALRAADHLLLSRYYDYAQLPFHKTLTAMELSLKKVVKNFLENGILKCSRKEMDKKVLRSKWETFDDPHLISCMREQLHDGSNEGAHINKHIRAVLEKRPPKMVFSREKIMDENSVNDFMGSKALIKGKISGWADKFDIPIDDWEITDNKFKFTKFSNEIPIESLGSGGFAQTEQSELVRIKGCNKESLETSIPLISCENTVIAQLSKQRYVDVRLFVLIPENRDGLREEIECQVRTDLSITQN